MPKHHATRSLLLTCCLTLLLAGCNNAANQPPLSPTEAIKLAKDATKQVASPPRTYDIGMAGNGKVSETQTWPDTPGSKLGAYQTGGGLTITETGFGPPPTAPMTYTTIVITDSAGHDIIFQNNWPGNQGTHKHSWQFFVGNDGHVDFRGEDGDQLPSVPK